MSKLGKTIAALLCLTASPAMADDIADPFTCMATRAVELQHLGSVSAICTAIAIEFCVNQPNATGCLANIPRRREEYVTTMLSQFPDTLDHLDLSRFHRHRYPRALADLRSGAWRRDTTMDPEDCFRIHTPQEVCNVFAAMNVVGTIEHWAEVFGISWIET